MLGSGLNLVTTVIGFGMSATFIVFVCARLICGRAARADADAADAASVAAARALAQPPAPFDFDVEFRNVADLDRTVSAHLPTPAASVRTIYMLTVIPSHARGQLGEMFLCFILF
jgi:hypothetical protein